MAKLKTIPVKVTVVQKKFKLNSELCSDLELYNKYCESLVSVDVHMDEMVNQMLIEFIQDDKGFRTWKSELEKSSRKEEKSLEKEKDQGFFDGSVGSVA